MNYYRFKRIKLKEMNKKRHCMQILYETNWNKNTVYVTLNEKL